MIGGQAMVAAAYVSWHGFLGIAAVCALSSTAMAAGTGQRGAGWIADPTTGCEIWRAHPISDETVRWSGACRNGRANGRGVLRRIKNDRLYFRFNGEMIDGRYHGKGTMVWEFSGDRYDGDFVSGRRTGKGTYVWGPNSKWAGNVYVGDFIDGKRTGKGTFISKTTGDRYDGDYVNDKQTGSGVYVWKRSGNTYVGHFKNGRPHGIGSQARPRLVQGPDGGPAGGCPGDRRTPLPNARH